MIIYVDIDDTICRLEHKADYSTGKPIQERIEKINELYEKGNTIVYWTARGTMTGINWFEITYDQLKRWGAKFHELRMGKPAFDIFIDDKAFNSDTFFV
jgi:CMP-N,N'-diacetyllegionaminic acid synthase